MMGALADFLAAQRREDRRRRLRRRAVRAGEPRRAREPRSRRSSIQVVEKKSYPLGVKDLSPVLRDIKDEEPGRVPRHHLPARHVPRHRAGEGDRLQPEGVLRRGRHRVPASTADVMGPTVEGVMGIGTWNPKTSPAAKAYFDAHVAKFQKEPDRWASAHAWAGLQILQQAVEKVGPRPQGAARPHRQQRVRHHHRQDPLQGRRERLDPRHREPVAEGRVRGRVADRPRHRARVYPEAGLEVASPRVRAWACAGWLELARPSRADHRRHLRAGRDRPQPAVRADAHHEHRARRVPDAGRVSHLAGRTPRSGAQPAGRSLPAGLRRCCS